MRSIRIYHSLAHLIRQLSEVRLSIHPTFCVHLPTTAARLMALVAFVSVAGSAITT